MEDSKTPKKKPLSGAQKRKKKKSDGKWTAEDQVRHVAYNRQYNHEYQKTRKSRRGNTIKLLVDEVKLTKGCTDCGYKGHPVALQFDHLPGYKKVQDIARMATRSNSWAAICREMAKCEVVCANCHAIRSYNRGQHGKQPPPDSFPLFPGFHPLFDKAPQVE